MVKVNIDGKEYEGTDVTFSDYKACINGHVWSEPPKQSFISVPKEIKFVRRGINNLMLKINSHYLKWNSYNWAFIPENSFNPEQEDSFVDCVLIPCKKEDLKAGDFAFYKNGIYEDDMNSQIKIIDNYYLVTGEDSLVGTQFGYAKLFNLVQTSFDCFDDPGWFRVVPRSEVEKK